LDGLDGTKGNQVNMGLLSEPFWYHL